MKRWAILVVVLYFLTLIVLTMPLLLVAFYPTVNLTMPGGMLDVIDTISVWQYWVALGVMTAGQVVMLLVPVDLSLGRPTTQRSALWPILASGLMMGVLGVGAAISFDEFFRKGKAALLDTPISWFLLLAVWAVWTLVFYQIGRSPKAMDVVSRQCRYLLKGSILELLVAVPTHIVARHRNYCCAGFQTFLGIAFGLSVMLFSFGPGVFFLFVQRWKRLHPQQM
jgi:hypothetical protein